MSHTMWSQDGLILPMCRYSRLAIVCLIIWLICYDSSMDHDPFSPA